MKLRLFLFLFFPLFLIHAAIRRANPLRFKSSVVNLVTGRHRMSLGLALMRHKSTASSTPRYDTIDSVKKSIIRSLDKLDLVDSSEATKGLVDWFKDDLSRITLSETGVINLAHRKARGTDDYNLSYDDWPWTKADVAFRLARVSVQGSPELAWWVDFVLKELKELSPCEACVVMRKINFDWVYRHQRYPQLCYDFEGCQRKIFKPGGISEIQEGFSSAISESLVQFSPLFAVSGAKFKAAIEIISISEAERAQANKRFLAEILEDVVLTGAALFTNLHPNRWNTTSMGQSFLSTLMRCNVMEEVIFDWEGLKKTDSCEVIKKLCNSGFKDKGVISEVWNSLKALELMVQLPEYGSSNEYDSFFHGKVELIVAQLKQAQAFGLCDPEIDWTLLKLRDISDFKGRIELLRRHVPHLIFIRPQVSDK